MGVDCALNHVRLWAQPTTQQSPSYFAGIKRLGSQRAICGKKNNKAPATTRLIKKRVDPLVNPIEGHFGNVFSHKNIHCHRWNNNPNHYRNRNDHAEPNGIEPKLNDNWIENWSSQDHKGKVIDKRAPQFIGKQNGIIMRWREKGSRKTESGVTKIIPYTISVILGGLRLPRVPRTARTPSDSFLL
jgi:hypothetical protein